MGACGNEVGYLSAGTSMDYAYEMNVINIILLI